MKSHLLTSFTKIFNSLPPHIRQDAKKAYRQFKANPRHPGLHFEQVRGKDGKTYHSVRVGINYRVLGIMRGGEIYWFWIGTHADYDKLIA